MDKLKAKHALRFLIVGGGTAGLSCAIGLARAGHKVTVFEQTDGTRRVGGLVLMYVRWLTRLRAECGSPALSAVHDARAAALGHVGGEAGQRGGDDVEVALP